MTPKQKRAARVLLPDRTVSAEYDDSVMLDYDAELATDLRDAAEKYLAAHPELTPGRPSLSAPGIHSPHVSFRVPADLARRLDRQSAAEGISRSALARRALAEYLDSTRRAG